MLNPGQPIRRPLVGIALVVTGGIYAGSRDLLQIEEIMVLSAFVLLAGFVLIRSRGSSVFVFSTLGLLAGLHFMISGSTWSAGSIGHRLAELPLRDVEIVGKVCGSPRFYAFKSGDRGMWVFPLEVEGIRENDRWLRQQGEIDVRVMGAYESEPSARRGARVWLRGELQKRNYRSGNTMGLKVSWPRYCRQLSGPAFSIMAWCRNWRESAAGRLEAGLEHKPVQLAVLRSLILGYRNEIPSEVYACFKRTGSLHIFAISGLHVGIIGLLLVIGLKSMGIPRGWFGVWLIPLLFIYVAATGMKASALRATIMASVFLLAPLFRRKPDIPTSVAVAAILLLVLNPQALQSAGFVFSFVVVAFIVMVYSAVPERWLGGSWIRSYSFSLAITSVAASLASMPMTAYYFGRFSPIALLGNLAVVPLTFCIVLSGWLSILVPPASIIFNHAAVAFINAMLWIVQGLDALPGSSFAVEAPPIAAMILWYGSLIYLLVHARCRKQRVYALAGACCSILCAVMF